MSKKKKELPFLIQNKKARHDYAITETLEVGLSLTGSEVKSLREKQGILLEAYVSFKNNEMYLQNCHIPEYKNGGYANHAPLRLRKLLAHKEEIEKLYSLVKEKGVYIVPLKIYLKGRRIKLLVGMGKPKKKADKREAIKEKDAKKQIKSYA